MTKFTFASIAAATLAVSGAAVAQEEATVAMADVPPVVMEAAMANANGVTFDTVAMDDGVYEFAGKMASGMGLEVDVREDGTIEEVEEQIDAAALPAEVAAALESNMAGFTPSYVEQSTREGGEIIYEFEGTFDGKEIDAEINADGSNFVMNDDAAG